MRLIELFNFRKDEIKTQQQRSAVIALGGGGARGVAHLGAIESIGESGVQTERIVGVSMGALVGAMCAVDPEIHRVQAKAIELLYSPVFLRKCCSLTGPASKLSDRDSECMAWYGNWYGRIKKSVANSRRFRRALKGPSLMRDNLLREAIEYLLPDIDIADTEIPLSIVTADLMSGHRVVLENGSLREAVLASTAIPGFFPPVAWDDGKAQLCDVGTLDSLPVAVAQSYARDLVIGVDVGNDQKAIQRCGTAIEVMMRMDEIGERIVRREMMKMADLVIRPEVGNRLWFDFSDPEQLIDEGRIAARQALRSLPLAVSVQ
ncbi:MAG: patatin-like phospholipase family protein [Pirellulaceae bacterium]|nr:patatin-like phospholipase family protein [Pirellulaceae bacterium]